MGYNVAKIWRVSIRKPLLNNSVALLVFIYTQKLSLGFVRA